MQTGNQTHLLNKWQGGAEEFTDDQQPGTPEHVNPSRA